MKIPNKIVVGPYTWTVEKVDHLLCDKDDAAAVGTCDPNKHVIKVYTGVSQQAQESAFVHELIHAILFAIQSPRRKYTDEDICSLFEPVLYGLIKRYNWM